MRIWVFCAVLVAYLVLVGWSVARADTIVTVLHPTPGIAIEAEVRDLGMVQLEGVEDGVVGGAGWARYRVLADVGPTYEMRVRARAGDVVSEWSPWKVLTGPPVETCVNDTGTIGAPELIEVLNLQNTPGRVCVK